RHPPALSSAGRRRRERGGPKDPRPARAGGRRPIPARRRAARVPRRGACLLRRAPPERQRMDTDQEVIHFQKTFSIAIEHLHKSIVGQSDALEYALIGLIAGGHVLLEGAPGLGKTRLVKALSRIFNLQFSRIQFTPDLMPADILGTNILSQN